MSELVWQHVRHFVCSVFILDVKCHFWHFNEVNIIRTFLAAKPKNVKMMMIKRSMIMMIMMMMKRMIMELNTAISNNRNTMVIESVLMYCSGVTYLEKSFVAGCTEMFFKI